MDFLKNVNKIKQKCKSYYYFYYEHYWWCTTLILKFLPGQNNVPGFITLF